MNEYITREELAIEFMYADADVVEDYGDGECEWGFSRRRIHEVINGVPSADVAPVRRGRWVQDKQSKFEHRYNCSACNYRLIDEPCNYCPNCGAKMDLEVTNDS